MTIVDLLILAGACWYVSFVLTSTEGPGGVFLRIREHVWHGRRGTFIVPKLWNVAEPKPELDPPVNKKNGLLDCIVCLAFWIAQALAFVSGHTFIDGLAIAGVSLWAHSWFGWRYSPPGS